MGTWPVDGKAISLGEKTNKPSNRQMSSAGYPMSFPKGTTLKRIFNIQFDFISKAEKDEIETFFDTYQGASFTLNSQDPNSSDTYTVIFNQDDIEFTYQKLYDSVDSGKYSTTIEFAEV